MSGTKFDFTAWRSSVLGKLIDHDGYPIGNKYQCHDLWLDILYKLGGVNPDGYAPEDVTSSVFTHFPYTAHVGTLFTKHGGLAGVRAGDVIFWAPSVWYPGSHVAVATGPVTGGLVPCVSQNPGPVRQVNLITSGALGYLRPNAITTAPTPTKGREVQHYNFQHRENRTIAPKQRLYLCEKSRKKDLAPKAGEYAFVAHVYGDGFAEGDVLELRYEWVDSKTGKMSPHYLHRVYADKYGMIRESAPFQRAVAAGQAVYLSVYASQGNKKHGTVSVLDSDSHCFNA